MLLCIRFLENGKVTRTILRGFPLHYNFWVNINFFSFRNLYTVNDSKGSRSIVASLLKYSGPPRFTFVFYAHPEQNTEKLFNVVVDLKRGLCALDARHKLSPSKGAPCFTLHISFSCNLPKT